MNTLEPLTEPLPRFSEDAEEAEPAPDLADLMADAELVLTSARSEAAELLDDARTQAEALREAAWQEGFHSGKVEARAAVETEMRADWAVRQDALRAELDAIAADIATAREALWLSQESEMVALTLDIARQVIKTEVTQNPAVVHAVIANALRRITDKENVRVRVSVVDAPRVKEAREDLMEIVDGLRFIEIVEDRRVGDGGCVIETNAGTIDAKIETQIAEVARALGISENE
ncbi:MAG: FliH/SctL family protein [Janthinobacterium lividum]